MTVGAGAFLAVAVLAMNFYEAPDCTDRLLARAKRLEAVGRVEQALLASSEAEKSAVLAVTDQDSQVFADQARAASALTERQARGLGSLLAISGTAGEKELLGQFSKEFAELRRIDDELLKLAVKNTNLKALSLAFGPAAETLKQMDEALSRVLTAAARSTSPAAKRIMLLAAGADAGALRIHNLLAPHIAEESDPKMDELEAQIAMEHQHVREDLDGLPRLLDAGGSPDLQTARSSYAHLTEIRTQILKLSRENTNVRSLAISLNQKHKAMATCQAALAAIEQAIREELTDVGCETPTNPRKL
jgi:hypothetical protein